MKPIARIVEEILEDKPFLSESLAEGLINLSALARNILPEVEEIAKKTVNPSAIVMALKRLPLTREMHSKQHIQDILQGIGDITVRSNLTDFTFLNSSTLVENQAILLKEIQQKNDTFYTFSKGVNETTLVLSTVIAKEAQAIFSNETLLYRSDKISSITLKLPIENTRYPGLYYQIFKKLAWESINILEVISTTNEFTLVVHDRDVNKAFNVLKS